MNAIMTEISRLPTEEAIAFAAAHIGVYPVELVVQPVTGGYSLNRRAIVSAGESHLFVKEVDEALVEGDGELERGWLAKDHHMVTMLRGKGFASVANWSELSDDRNTLLLPAYRPEDGWLWELPQGDTQRQQYVEAVLDVASRLESLQFTDAEARRFSLTPYFRDKIAEDADLPVLADPGARELIVQKCDMLLEKQEHGDIARSLQGLRTFVHDQRQQNEVKELASQLRSQPNSAFGHCDLRSDNLAYHRDSHEVVLVDWNWASYIPSGFGATEFLINVAKQGVDISAWVERLNQPLVAAVVGFWLRAGLKPSLGGTSHLRDHQIIAAAVSVSLLLEHGSSVKL